MSLPEPDFLERDPAVIEREIFELWESLGGEPLEPAQPEALFLRAFAYRETLLRIAVQEAAKLNLVRWSRFPMLDFIGEFLEAPRLEPSAAVTTLRWTLDEVHGEPRSVPAGSRVKSRDGRVVFATSADAIVDTGELTVDVEAVATLAGEQANGYLPGQVSVVVDSFPFVVTAENLTETDGGTSAETDERYVERILLSPDQHGAGSVEAYQFLARSASLLVADVAVQQPVLGSVRVVVLSTEGLPSSELLELVEERVTAERDRPLNDTVDVDAPDEVTWSLHCRVKLYRNADFDSAMAAAEAGGEAYQQSRRLRLGRDLVPDQVARRVGVSGVYSVEVVSPALTVIAVDEWANCESVLIEFDGWVEEDDPEVAS